MKVYSAKIIGLFAGLLFGGYFSSQLIFLGTVVGLIGVVELVRNKGQLLKGPYAGLIVGILAGYFLFNFITALPRFG